MQTGGRVALIGGLCLLVLTISITAAGGQFAPEMAVFGADATSDGPQPSLQQSDQPTTDNSVTRIRLAANGTAYWTVRIRTRLASDERVESYEAFQRRVRENTSQYRVPFARRITRVVGAAENETGRNMTAREFRVETTIQELPRRWGVVTYRFTWTGFASPENESLVVSDVFQQGFYLAANDSLEIVPPDGHAIARVEPEPTASQNGSVEWTGVEDFADGRPLLRVSPTDRQRQQADTPTPRARTTETDGTGDTASVWPVALGAAGLLVLVVIGYLLLRDRTEETETETTDTDITTDPPSTASDQGEVRRLIEDHGGQMSQGDIDDAFEWSKAKTSRILSQMADDGTVEKTQIGRQNIVTLVDNEERQE